MGLNLRLERRFVPHHLKPRFGVSPAGRIGHLRGTCSCSLGALASVPLVLVRLLPLPLKSSAERAMKVLCWRRYCPAVIREAYLVIPVLALVLPAEQNSVAA